MDVSRPMSQKLRSLVWVPLVGAIAVFPAGCALPESHLPGGFSSTYYRHLRQSEVITAEATMPETQPQRKWWSWKW